MRKLQTCMRFPPLLKQKQEKPRKSCVVPALSSPLMLPKTLPISCEVSVDEVSFKAHVICIHCICT